MNMHYYFSIRTMEGGAATGFRSVPPEEYSARLFHIARDKNGPVVVREVSECDKYFI